MRLVDWAGLAVLVRGWPARTPRWWPDCPARSGRRATTGVGRRLVRGSSRGGTPRLLPEAGVHPESRIGIGRWKMQLGLRRFGELVTVVVEGHLRIPFGAAEDAASPCRSGRTHYPLLRLRRQRQIQEESSISRRRTVDTWSRASLMGRRSAVSAAPRSVSAGSRRANCGPACAAKLLGILGDGRVSPWTDLGGCFSVAQSIAIRAGRV